MDEQKKTVGFDYIKSNQFRVIHLDGVFGGVTPHGFINMDLWSSRVTIPQHITHEVVGEELGDEIRSEREGRDAPFIREVEASVIMTPGLAKALISWLQSKLDSIDEIENRKSKEIE